MDDEQSGEVVAKALRSLQAASVRQALVGCHFYRDDPDAADEVVAAPAGEPVIVLWQANSDLRLPYGAFRKVMSSTTEAPLAPPSPRHDRREMMRSTVPGGLSAATA